MSAVLVAMVYALCMQTKYMQTDNHQDKLHVLYIRRTVYLLSTFDIGIPGIPTPTAYISPVGCHS